MSKSLPGRQAKTDISERGSSVISGEKAQNLLEAAKLKVYGAWGR